MSDPDTTALALVYLALARQQGKLDEAGYAQAVAHVKAEAGGEGEAQEFAEPWEEGKHARGEHGRFASVAHRAAAVADAKINRLHRQVRDRESSAADADLEASGHAGEAHERVRRAAAGAFAHASRQALAAHGDSDVTRALLADRRVHVRERLADVEEALHERAAHPAAQAGREDREAGRADVHAAIGQLHATLEGVGSYVAANHGAAARGQSVQEAAALAGRLMKRKTLRPQDEDALRQAGSAERFARLSRQGERFRIDTPLLSQQGGYLSVEPDRLQLRDADTHEATTPVKLKEKRPAGS